MSERDATELARHSVLDAINGMRTALEALVGRHVLHDHDGAKCGCNHCVGFRALANLREAAPLESDRELERAALEAAQAIHRAGRYTGDPPPTTHAKAMLRVLDKKLRGER